MAESRYAGPLDEWIISEGTLSWVANADTAYPAANAKNHMPDVVTKNTTTNGTLRATLGGSRTAVGAAIFNTNATSISLQNAAGLNQTMTPLAREGDSQTVDPFIDVTGLANITSNVWDFVLSKSGSTPLEVGEVRLIKTWRTMPFLYPSGHRRNRPGNEVLVTRLGHKLKWPSYVRQDMWAGSITKDTDLAQTLALEAESSGPMVPFVFIYQMTTNRAALVEFTNRAFENFRQDLNVTTVQIELEELSKGVPPAAS